MGLPAPALPRLPYLAPVLWILSINQTASPTTTPSSGVVPQRTPGQRNPLTPLFPTSPRNGVDWSQAPRSANTSSVNALGHKAAKLSLRSVTVFYGMLIHLR